MIERGISKNITVSYATNGTIFPNMQLRTSDPYFKNIIIMLSADGIEKGFEYSRYPEWSVYEDTLQRYVDAGILYLLLVMVLVYIVSLI